MFLAASVPDPHLAGTRVPALECPPLKPEPSSSPAGTTRWSGAFAASSPAPSGAGPRQSSSAPEAVRQASTGTPDSNRVDAFTLEPSKVPSAEASPWAATQPQPQAGNAPKRSFFLDPLL